MSTELPRMYRRIAAQLQPQVDAPILALGVFHPVGTIARIAIIGGLQGGLATGLLVRNRGKPSAGVPPVSALAVTDTMVYMFELTQMNKLKRLLRTWDRDGLEVTVQKKMLTYRVQIPSRDGAHIELEGRRRGGNRHQYVVIRHLTEPPTYHHGNG